MAPALRRQSLCAPPSRAEVSSTDLSFSATQVIHCLQFYFSRFHEERSMVIGTRFLAVGTLALMALMAVGQTALAADVRLFVRHDVADFGAWKKGYDSHADWQKKMGVFNQAVYQSTSNPNDVTVIHDFHSLEEAKAFLASAELKDRMDKIGVKGTPQMWFTGEVK
jgi:hypothetical protein